MKNELYNFIIDKFDKGINEIDVVNGIIYSVKDKVRRKIGSRLKNRKKETVYFYFKGRNISIPVCDIVWVCVNGLIPDDIEVGIKNDLLGNGIDNLFLKKKQKKPVRWSDEEVSILKELIEENFSWNDISEKMNRSEKSCRHKSKKIGLKKVNIKRMWTKDEESQMLKLLHSGKNINMVAKDLGRSFQSVSLRARKFGRTPASTINKLKPINKNNFYSALKNAKSRGSVSLYCCLCDSEEPYKYCSIHHIDENRDNNHISNIATLCPNHHAEAHGGDHVGKILYAKWDRVHHGNIISKNTNMEYINE